MHEHFIWAWWTEFLPFLCFTHTGLSSISSSSVLTFFQKNMIGIVLGHPHTTILPIWPVFQQVFAFLLLFFTSFTIVDMISGLPTFPCCLHQCFLETLFWPQFVCFHSPGISFLLLLSWLLSLSYLCQWCMWIQACPCVFRIDPTFFRDGVNTAWMDVSVSISSFSNPSNLSL